VHRREERVGHLQPQQLLRLLQTLQQLVGPLHRRQELHLHLLSNELLLTLIPLDLLVRPRLLRLRPARVIHQLSQQPREHVQQPRMMP